MKPILLHQKYLCIYDEIHTTTEVYLKIIKYTCFGQCSLQAVINTNNYESTRFPKSVISSKKYCTSDPLFLLNPNLPVWNKIHPCEIDENFQETWE